MFYRIWSVNFYPIFQFENCPPLRNGIFSIFSREGFWKQEKVTDTLLLNELAYFDVLKGGLNLDPPPHKYVPDTTTTSDSRVPKNAFSNYLMKCIFDLIFRPTIHRNQDEMRSIALTVWFFLNVVLLGMCGYIYLLWLQYWHRISFKIHQAPETTITQQQPYVEYYDEGDFTTIRQSLRNGNSLMRMSEKVLDKTEKIRQVT